MSAEDAVEQAGSEGVYAQTRLTGATNARPRRASISIRDHWSGKTIRLAPLDWHRQVGPSWEMLMVSIDISDVSFSPW